MDTPNIDLNRPRRLNGGLFVALALFLIFWQAGKFAANRQDISDWLRTRSPSARDVDHPIPRLMAEAEDKFRNLLAKQSKTLAEAVAEYKKRYKRDPPKGFDDWFTFAINNDIKIIDEYDSVFQDLDPFWDLSGYELRRRVEQVSVRHVSLMSSHSFLLFYR